MSLDNTKHKVQLKAIIFDYDKTISESDVYNDDWDEDQYPKLFFGSEKRLKRLKLFFERLHKHEVKLQIVSYNLYKNIDQSLELTELWD